MISPEVDADAVSPSDPAGVLLAPVAGRRNRPRAWWRSVIEYGGLIIAALVLASLIRAFLGLAFWIPSESMYPTLKIHDRVVVSRL